ncbi:FGGY family carbohydrate kinase [uncultured Microbacterium sp.]|uniref:FGGY family carbohydrate kinase n=1 Tax=uncultured Microbacterium sp. TaxID=191216 RepID=UPI0028D4DE1C|nr:FGGY family carbohydrate kinase [uncultured Microbacterium sp.]
MIALGIDVGSTAVKASVIEVGATVTERSVVQTSTAGRDAAGLAAASLRVAADALRRADCGPARVIGIASMAETGALTDDAGTPRGPLLRWDRDASHDRRPEWSGRLDAAALHAATGVPLTAKLPLLTWAEVCEGRSRARWAFAADLIAVALTGRRVTDHTLAGRSGALPLPPAGHPLRVTWDDAALAEFGIPLVFPPRILAPGEPAGTVTASGVVALDGRVDPSALVFVAGHDHAVAAWVAGIRSPGGRVRSIGTTEAVVAVADDGVDRRRAGEQGFSVVRTVNGDHEAVLAGSPAAGSLFAQWRERALHRGGDADGLAGRTLSEPGPDAAIALPYPRGRQCPHPDASATLRMFGVADGDVAAELHALLRGVAAHGGWMLEAADDVSGPGSAPRLVGAPFRLTPRLAALAASVAGQELELIDLQAPVATGAAALAAVRGGEVGDLVAPTRTVGPDPLTIADVVAHFRAALVATGVPIDRRGAA